MFLQSSADSSKRAKFSDEAILLKDDHVSHTDAAVQFIRQSRSQKGLPASNSANASQSVVKDGE